MTSNNRAFTSGWHPGEKAVQALMGLPERVSIDTIVNKIPDQHRTFHSTRLQYITVTTLDVDGRPWASILCPTVGASSFITSPTDTSLIIHARLWSGDPMPTNLSLANQVGKALISGIGLEPITRRRNKFAGHICEVSTIGHDTVLKIRVSQALGLCPKYINCRELAPYADTASRVIHEEMHPPKGDRLPVDVIDFICSADTAYLASYYAANPEDERAHPSHVGTNHRGGRPGFIRVWPRDGRTVVLPNYTGNRMMNSLGNIHVTPVAGLVIPSSSTGSVVYISGVAKTVFGPAARQIMSRVNAVTTIYVTGFSFVENALPLREVPGTGERSPYNPPICYLAEEEPPQGPLDDAVLRLVKTRVLTAKLATFTFEASRPVDVQPSQNCVLDLSDFVRGRSHRLVNRQEGLQDQNDDCVRTWTAFCLPSTLLSCRLSITMRLVEHGLITPILHEIAKSVDPFHEGREVDVSALGIVVQLRGIGGGFSVPEPLASCDGGRWLLWIAGGIGLTPFLSLTTYATDLAKRGYGKWNVVLVVSTREPGATVALLNDAFKAPTVQRTEDRLVNMAFEIHLFAPDPPTDQPSLPPFVSLTHHSGRIDVGGTFFSSVDASRREPSICGPLPFVLTAVQSLGAAGVDPECVQREHFTY